MTLKLLDFVEEYMIYIFSIEQSIWENWINM